MTLSTDMQFTVNSRNYDGAIRRSWQCEFVESGKDSVDLVGFFDQTVDHPDLGRIEKGTLSREKFYRDRWYNYFIFEYPAGTLRNYYINICMPPKIGEGVIDYVDLDIDLILWPDGMLVTLDLDEFEVNAGRFTYPTAVRENALRTLKEIQGSLADTSNVRRAVARLKTIRACA